MTQTDWLKILNALTGIKLVDVNFKYQEQNITISTFELGNTCRRYQVFINDLVQHDWGTLQPKNSIIETLWFQSKNESTADAPVYHSIFPTAQSLVGQFKKINGLEFMDLEPKR